MNIKDKIAVVAKEYKASSGGWAPKTLTELKDKQIENALRGFARGCVKNNISVMVDTTLFKSGKAGFLFSDTGIYSTCFDSEIAYKDIKAVRAGAKKDQIHFDFTDGREKEFSVDSAVRDDVQNTINDILKLLKKEDAPAPLYSNVSKMLDDECWRRRASAVGISLSGEKQSFDVSKAKAESDRKAKEKAAAKAGEKRKEKEEAAAKAKAAETVPGNGSKPVGRKEENTEETFDLTDQLLKEYEESKDTPRDGVYEGPRVGDDGVMDGEGKMTWPNGDVYVGKFDDDELVKGKLTKANGDVLEGRIDKNRNLKGYGKITYANGKVVEGNWRDGKIVEFTYEEFLNLFTSSSYCCSRSGLGIKKAEDITPDTRFYQLDEEIVDSFIANLEEQYHVYPSYDFSDGYSHATVREFVEYVQHGDHTDPETWKRVMDAFDAVD